MSDERARDDAAQDARAERRDQRKASERARMNKHGARTGEAYRNAIMKRLRARAGTAAGKEKKR